MNETVFSFPMMTNKKGIKLEVVWTPKTEKIMDKIYDSFTELEQLGLTPATIIVGFNQFKEILAHFSYQKQEALFVNRIEQVPIVLLDQSDFFDVLPHNETVFKKWIKQCNGVL